MKFVYAIIHDNEYDIDEIFESDKDAIYAAVVLRENVAVLDALSLEYLGEI